MTLANQSIGMDIQITSRFVVQTAYSVNRTHVTTTSFPPGLLCVCFCGRNANVSICGHQL